MKLKFIANACCIVESKKGTKIVSDPWLNDGVFEGSWCHFHELKTTWDDLQSVDAVYVSHVHPDHFDNRFFQFPKDTPMIVLDHGKNFLHKNLISMGYTNLIKVKNYETLPFKDFKLSLFAPFVGHNFFEENTKIGNLIDSAIVYEADNQSIFNANDNNPDPDSCRELKKRFGTFDLSMMNYNSAGPYPSCFNNLNEEEKAAEHSKNLQRNVDYLYENLKILSSKYFLPFAGAYVLGGKLAYKNKYLGTMSWDKCIEMLKDKENIQATEYIALNEGTTFDLDSGEPDCQYQQIDENKIKVYVESTLSKLKYPYELDEMPDKLKLEEDINKAVSAMNERLDRIKLIPDMCVFLEVGEKEIPIIKVSDSLSKGNLKCTIDPRLLRRILDRSSHWNNAEIGCHIEFSRKPNYYSPDIHTALQFFHL
jgi:UDP-MurNAc hydroxylase